MEQEKQFEAFFRENYTRFYFFALQFINDEEACKDIVSDSFEFAWDKFNTVEVNNWKSYLLSYIRNKCVDYIRHQEVKKRYVEFYQKMVMENRYMHTPEYDERILKIRKIIAGFPPQTRLVFQECYLREKTYKEVAEELGVSINAIKKHIVKALKILRESTVNKNQCGTLNSETNDFL
ncbi:MAG: RNA polymerase sigma-70 factor [Bacteroides sp.]|nr:RNA polymerase sigma-70 factor [Bacteroides sp.]